MEHIEEFTLEGRNFIFFDLSGLKTSKDYNKFISDANLAIKKFPEQSLYTITNLKQVRFDSVIKDSLAEWINYNKPYVRHGVVIGANGIKKLMFTSLMSKAARDNIVYLSTKEQAIAWLLKQE